MQKEPTTVLSGLPNSRNTIIIQRDQKFHSSVPGTYPRGSRKTPPHRDIRKLDAREAEEAERLAALEAVARTAPPQPPPAMSRREQLFARPLTGRSRLDNMVAAGLVEEDDEDAWAADLEEELFS